MEHVPDTLEAWQAGLVLPRDAGEATPGPLPLLQFSAAKLWALRDNHARYFYERVGGKLVIEGGHAVPHQTWAGVRG